MPPPHWPWAPTRSTSRQPTPPATPRSQPGRFTVVGPSVTPDKDPPETTIKKVKVRGDQAKVKFFSSETGSTFQCKLDKGKLRPCRSPRTLKNLATGKHQLKVSATDAVGNADPTAAKTKFRI